MTRMHCVVGFFLMSVRVKFECMCDPKLARRFSVSDVCAKVVRSFDGSPLASGLRHGLCAWPFGGALEWAGDAAGACLRLFVTCLVLRVATTRFFRTVNAFAESVGAPDLDPASRVLGLCLLR